MIFRITVMALSAVILLAWVWIRSRRIARAKITQNEMPGRGVIGEATTAYEDLARQFLDEGSDRPKKLRPAKVDRSR
jgi:hypothetical protein